MLDAIARRLFGSANDRYLRGLNKIVDQINALEADIEGLSDTDLAARTPWLKERLEGGESLDDILPDAFATVREAAKRALGERHFDVQLVGGVVLHRGMIAEMKTGEGKTLCSTLAVYLNALTGNGVHIITVNEYLAARDTEWMGRIYGLLDMSVGCIVPGLSDAERTVAYQADITYGTNFEFGFDYLRDNMKFALDEMVQRPFNFGIVDEVDSILIDEARTPLIISGASEDSSDLYDAVDKVIPDLVAEDYEKDEKVRSVTLTDIGNEHAEELLGEAGLITSGNLYDYSNISLVHHINQALRAHKLFERDTDYIVKDGRVIIIDEFTGRMMEGRRFSEGLHQALEAKEGVEVENENQTLASITYQNYFRMYPKLAGMTGTAMTEAGEFSEIYKLEVVDIPTNVLCIRDDQDDEVYRTAAEKHDAILELISDCQERGQPVLVGTVSIEKSEQISDILKAKKITHQVLNARYHEREAHIIAQAGAPGSVTIATNMAGRGTDIQMGGNIDMLLRQELDGESDTAKHAEIETRIKKQVADGREKAVGAGGLMVIGTERHESRRVDNQLRGRSGRQGDPGDSKFFLSLEDDLMRIFGSERMDGMLTRLGLEEGEAIIHPWINKALEKAQQKVEARNFDIRKNLLKFDDVMNDQRKVIYEQRRDLMSADDVSETVRDMRENVIDKMVGQCMPEKAYAEQWDTGALHEELMRVFGLDLPVADWAKEEGVADAEVRERISDAARRKMAEKAATWTPDVMRDVEKNLLMQVLDQVWKEHLLGLDHLRQGIGLRAYGQKDPLNEYKSEAFEMFNGMLEELDDRITLILAQIQLQISGLEDMDLFARSDQQTMEVYEDPAFAGGGLDEEEDDSDYGLAVAPVVSRQSADVIDPEDPTTWGKVGRNSACPCGSGKKYKHCHGAH
ncbi:MAG: preprotein translocase subunit SecA [Rhodospirillales bacterium]|jgi:preprotein translocase subunit SecA|nr:preprotein translocase subunit SecA [Rhodospirillaceae bacterium]MDP6842215.1 preprotein translocase subunit SecA [Rhodospirillales bacterium]